ncbi:hypothetical protein ACVWWS_000159 [Pseudomonas chlororaphis]
MAVHKYNHKMWLMAIGLYRVISKNHGRIVVLPYIKENGQKVQGHTKNSSHEKKALPRHPDEYVEVPFEVLRGDLMIELFGGLPYE